LYDFSYYHWNLNLNWSHQKYKYRRKGQIKFPILNPLKSSPNPPYTKGEEKEKQISLVSKSKHRVKRLAKKMLGGRKRQKLRGTDLKIKIIRVCSDSDHRKRGKSFA
jgi:hypothetical protein